MNETKKELTEITAEELEKINRYTRRPMAAEELYTFTVVLCDNEVDRDCERFTAKALEGLAQLFLGKTGIFDHSARAEHQAARIYETALEEDPARRVPGGEVYTRLTAKAYLPRSEKNTQLILEIDSGMKKEVSVGCSMGSRVCSVCGADRLHGGCSHTKGAVYQGEVVHDVLSDPLDAYEWSFVAVPAQRDAGVIKAFDGSWEDPTLLEKLFADAEEVRLTKTALQQLRRHLNRLEEQAAMGGRYREQLLEETRKLCRLAQPELSEAVAARMLEQCSLADLEQLHQAYGKQAAERYPLRPQLWNPKAQEHTEENQVFKI